VPDLAAGELEALAGAIRDSFDRAGGRARWEETAKLHATLHFLGDVEDDAIPALGTALTTAASGHAAFELTFDGVGAFPPRGAPRILYAAAGKGAASLVALAASLQDALAHAGASRPDKPFHAHVTLARVKTPPRRGWRFAGPMPSIATRVESVALYRSVLAQNGARHTAIVTAALA
jgi:RNA 2',3'-cyclic 3'-phosphodiesterase